MTFLLLNVGCAADAGSKAGGVQLSYTAAGSGTHQRAVAVGKATIDSLLALVADRSEMIECLVTNDTVQDWQRRCATISLSMANARPVNPGLREEVFVNRVMFVLAPTDSEPDGVLVVLGATRWFAGAYSGSTGRRAALAAARTAGLELDDY